MRNVTHTYQPDITEQFVPYQHFYLHQVYMTNSDTPSATSSLYNVQPTPNNSTPLVFPSLPYSKKTLEFIKKFSFQFCDLTDTDYITLCNFLHKYKIFYATRKKVLEKLQPHFALDLNLTLNLFHNVLLNPNPLS